MLHLVITFVAGEVKKLPSKTAGQTNYRPVENKTGAKLKKNTFPFRFDRIAFANAYLEKHPKTSILLFTNSCQSMKSIVLSMLLPLFFLLPARVQALVYSASLEEATLQALQENKLVFLEFRAPWCEPCTWMDNHTYNNVQVKNLLESRYVPVRVDIESKAGQTLLRKFQVTLLPSIIVLNTLGLEVDRAERPLASTDLMNLLQNHKPLQIQTELEAYENYGHAEKKTALPALNNTIISSSASQPATTNPGFPPGGLYRLHSFLLQYEGYSIQTGVYSDWANVEREIEHLEKVLGKEAVILVHPTKKDGKIHYLVLTGHFSDSAAARLYQKEMAQAGLSGFLKPLAALKKDLP